MSRDEIRFLADVSSRPLSMTDSRYQRLHLSRRRGNAIRSSLLAGKLIEAVPIATRSGQVVLYELSDLGHSLCPTIGINSGSRPRASLEHRFWVMKVAAQFEKLGFKFRHEHVLKGNGAIDVVAKRPGERVAVEVETGKSDIHEKLRKLRDAGFDRIIVLATSPSAVTACGKAIYEVAGTEPVAEMWTWLDVS